MSITLEGYFVEMICKKLTVRVYNPFNRDMWIFGHKNLIDNPNAVYDIGIVEIVIK